MHEVNVRGILSAKNGMNLYRGCQHGCIYCDARSRCYQINHDFEDIEVKANAPELLAQELARKRRRCMIGTGGMSDPYIPLEKELRLTRRCLEIIEARGFGLAIQTKSASILRDLDVLEAIHAKGRCVVQMTLTTSEEALCRIVEPNVSTTRERVEALARFAQAGIPTVVWLTPILPFINDTRENVLAILRDCRAAGVRGIISFGMGLTLREGDREYFYQKLDAHFPGLKQRYVRTYGNAYELPSPRHAELMRAAEDFCREAGIIFDDHEVFRYLYAWKDETIQQTTLF